MMSTFPLRRASLIQKPIGRELIAEQRQRIGLGHSPQRQWRDKENSRKMKTHVSTCVSLPCQEAEPDNEIWVQPVKVERKQNQARTWVSSGVCGWE